MAIDIKVIPTLHGDEAIRFINNADEVEEAEGEIDKCRDTKNRTLRHTAGCPWNRYALRLAGHQSPRHILRDGTVWDASGNIFYVLDF